MSVQITQYCNVPHSLEPQDMDTQAVPLSPRTKTVVEGFSPVCDYNMHTPNEFIVVEDVEKAIEAGLNIVEKLGYNKFEYRYEKPSHLQYGLFNLGDMGDEDEDDDMDNPPFDTDDFDKTGYALI